MKHNKNIDQLFKEHFQHLETPPPPEAWNRIEKQLLEEKEERKVIPIWWKLAGIAAVLLVLLTAGNVFFDASKNGNDTIIVDVESSENNKNANKIEETTIDHNSQLPNETQLVTEQTNKKEDTNTLENKNILKERINNAAHNNNAKQNIANAPNSSLKNNTKQSAKQAGSLANKLNNQIKKDEYKNLGVAQITHENENLNNSNKIIDKNNAYKKRPLEKESYKTHKNTQKEYAIAIEEEATNTVKKEEATDVKNEKQSIFDAIKEAEDAVAVQDKEKSIINRWEVAPNVGPVYYSSLTEGSSIDPMFADNSQSSDINISYGIQVAYQINNRLSIRSGISNVNLSYGTGDLELGTGSIDAALQSITYGNTNDGFVLTAVDQGTIQEAATNPNDPFSNLVPRATSGDVILTQNISYLEIPTELKYKLLNRKLGVDLIGGVSTLFLGNNEVSVASENFSSVLGEANNLNDVSFTTNIGLGINYQLSKRLRFNVEPTFKYQLNPYSDNSVNFSPYYIGLYSGLSLKF